MAIFISIPSGMINAFTGKAKRDGKELDWKAIRPIEIESPKNRHILPARTLGDFDIMEAFPQLVAMPQLDESEIVFKQSGI